MQKKRIHNKKVGISKKRKNRMIALTVTGIVLIGLTILALLLILNNDANVIVFSVNDEPVTREEFKIRMNESKSVTFAYFVEKYDASDSKTFWTDDFKGEVPIIKLKTDVINQMKEIRMKQIIAKENGLIDYINYSDFKRRLVEENIRRAEAVKKNEPIYGPVEYNENEYYRYVLGNMEEELQDKLSKTSLAVTEEEVKEYYENNKDQFKAPSSTIADMIIVKYKTDDDVNDSQGLEDKARQICRQIKAKIDETGDFNEAIKDIESVDGITVTNRVREFNSKTRMYDESMPEVLTAVETLPIGQVSDIIEEQDGSFTILKVNEKKTEGYKTFEEVRELAEKRLVSEMFDKMVSDRLEKAKIVINEKVYDNVMFE